MAESFTDLEGRTFELCDLGPVKLIALLGGGRLSQVFRGESQDHRTVAVKIARNDLDENMATNFRSEYETLGALRRKAKELVVQKTTSGFAASYFPEPLCFIPEQIAHHGRYSIVALELIQAPKLIDLAVSRDRHVLEEPFGLETAIQYAEILQVLHAADYTASDRKIDDIYWRDGPTGSLVVLDWNVVGRGQAGIPNDLFRFGVFWYEFLVGQSPRFADVGVQRIARLNAWPGWQDLSRGAREILEKALHPVAKKRYQTADELKLDLVQQLKCWSEPLDALWSDGRNSDLDPLRRLVALDMAKRRNYSANDLDGMIADLDTARSTMRFDSFRNLVDRFIEMGATHGQ